ncbi:hypothetical protein EVAR_27441_1 [Eumeta japonica]|uniref:Uncharacterized protein n=1 Tax=Eumeta variegata TaxID=151549 RepID=A0A4C1VL02_EUMVA|nr:hypothetical protein EVAR_27441_1 [Eumeta japonica]
MAYFLAGSGGPLQPRGPGLQPNQPIGSPPSAGGRERGRDRSIRNNGSCYNIINSGSWRDESVPAAGQLPAHCLTLHKHTIFTCIVCVYDGCWRNRCEIMDVG